MNTIPLWKASVGETQSYPRLSTNIEVDVVIIGGGITGITAALHLIHAGKKVAIIEANKIGQGTTGYSTGNLYIPVQPYYQKMLAKFDQETVKKIAHSRKMAIDYIEKTVNAHQISCGFHRRPWFAYTNTENEIDFLTKEVELLKAVEMPIEYTKDLPLGLAFKKAAVMENQARFHPLKYVVSLASYLVQNGAQIFEHSRVLDIQENGQCIVKTAEGSVQANSCIIATHTPIGINTIQMFTAPYRSYVVAVHLKEDHYPEGHFWNIENPHYATCTHTGGSGSPDLLVIAGSHHKTGQSDNAQAHYQELEQYLKQHYDVKEVAYRWSAQHYHAADCVPYIGLVGHYHHIYQATGFFADGLVYGTIAGMVLGDTILKQPNVLANIYNAQRHKPLASAEFFIKENLNVFMQYMQDFPVFASHQYNDLQPEEGRVVEINSEKLGVYKDSNLKLHVVSAICPHMRCVVNWNNAEKTWDCPCHGSRFSCDGKVLEGPAQHDLVNKTQEI